MGILSGYYPKERFTGSSKIHHHCRSAPGQNRPFQEIGYCRAIRRLQRRSSTPFALIQYHKPEQLIIVGDMFFIAARIRKWIFYTLAERPFQLNIELVKGNHDILHNDWYSQNSIKLNSSRLRVGSFSFVHDPAEAAISETEENVVLFFWSHASRHPHQQRKRQSPVFPVFIFPAEAPCCPHSANSRATSNKPKSRMPFTQL